MGTSEAENSLFIKMISAYSFFPPGRPVQKRAISLSCICIPASRSGGTFLAFLYPSVKEVGGEHLARYIRID
jgi:predicted alpha/beta-hydrolase family hydrolase